MDSFNLEHFHFLRPLWFFALLPLFILLYRISKRRLSEGDWASVVDPKLAPYVLIDEQRETRRNRMWLLALAGVIAITALAGPVWERLPQPLFRSQASLVIALDLSRSMDATDLNPSRLARARFRVADLVKQREDGQAALLVYAKDAYMVTPLTNDVDTILSQLQALSTDLMPLQGSRADRAIEKAVELLQQGGVARGDILLVTDSVNAERDSEMAREARKQAYQVHVLAMGTPSGAPIPAGNGSFLTDEEGNIVMPTLDKNALSAVASAGGGVMEMYTPSGSDIEHLLIQFDKTTDNDTSDLDQVEVKSDDWREVGPVLLLVLIPLAALGFRRGSLLSVLITPVLISLLIAPTKTIAADGLWQRADQQGAKLLESDPEAAAEKFTDPQWQGTAQYRAGDYDAALESWAGSDSAESWYNRGNAHAQIGEYQKALDAYKQALQKEPEMDDARHNYDQVKKAMEEKEQDDQQPNDEKNDQSEDGGGSEDQQGDDSSQSDPNSTDQSESESGEQPPSDQQESAEQESSGGESESAESGEQQSQQQQDAKSSGEKKEASGAQGESESEHDEDQQTTEAILRVIPDDPGGLLRRKFQYQYQQRDGRIRSAREETGEDTW